ncbi:MAG: DUF6069 family protein [Armatimonadota bacterium]|nr:DUF6069 family protein [Armatimonadota bacterium]
MSERASPRPVLPIWQGWVLALVSAAVANELLRLAATALFPVPPAFQPLTRPAVFFWTAVGTTGAALVYAALRRYAADPARTFRRVALAVLVLSWIPDVLLLVSPPAQLPPALPEAVVTLMVLHLPPWLASVGFLTGGVLPRRQGGGVLPEAGGLPCPPAGGKRGSPGRGRSGPAGAPRRSRRPPL